jgi:type I restriction enzyme M protein
MAMQSGFVKRIRDVMRMDAGINGDAQRIEQMVWMLFLKVYDAKEDDWELDEDNYVSIIPEECRWRNWAKADEKGRALTGDDLLDFVNNTLFPTLKKLNISAETPVKKAIVKSTFEDANNYMKDGVHLRQVIDIIDEIEFDDVKESHAFGFVYEEILRELQSAGSSGEFYTPRAVTDFMAHMIRPKIGERMADFACGTGGFLTSWLGELRKQITDTESMSQFDSSIFGIEKKPFPYLLCVTNMLLHDIEVPNILHANSLRHNLLDYSEDEKFDVVMMNPPYGGHEDKSIQSFFPDDLASSETADLFVSVIMYRLKEDGRAAVIIPDGFLSGTDSAAKLNIKRKLLTEFNLHTIIRLPPSVFNPYTSIATNILFFDNTGATKETWFYRVDMPADRKHFSKTKPMELKHFDEAISWWYDRKPIEIEGFPKAECYSVDYLLNDRGCDLDLCGYPHKVEIFLSPMETLQNYQEKRATLNAEIDKVLAELEARLKGGAEN